MQKADFEKKVQEKMQELRLHPSEEVWKRVETGIDGTKRRPSIFFWVPAAVLLLGVIGYFSYPNLISSANNSNGKANNTSINKSNQPGQTIANKQNISEAKDAATSKQVTSPSSAFEKNDAGENDVHVSINSSKTFSPNSTKKSKGSNYQHATQLPQPTSEPTIKDRVVASPNSNCTMHYSLPIANEQSLLTASIARQNLSTRNNLNSSQKTPSIPIAKKNNWEYELTFSAGMSNLTEGLFLSDSLRQLFSSPTSSGGGSGHGPSQVKSGLSFTIGATANKWLGAKWNVGVGLQYQYFSTSMRIGQKIDSSIFVYQNNASMSTVSGYYKSSGNTHYQNQFHFISIPVSVNWQFAPRFVWENQVNYSRLIATNALHYDGQNGAYYEDKDLLNKNQFMFASALKFGWNKNKFQVGPQLQYSSANLFANTASESKHLYSIAIKANMKLLKK